VGYLIWGDALELEDLEVYKGATAVGEKVWVIVSKREYFAGDTIGKQWVRSADPIAAN
jgi:hypothetical protein